MPKKIQKFILYSLLIYSILGFLVLPFILKSQIISVVQEEISAKISIDSVYFNPFIFKLKISEIELKTLDNKHLVYLKSLALNVEILSLLRSAVHVKNLILEKPEISLIYNSDKSFNFSKIVKANSEQKQDNNSSSGELPRIILDRVTIIDGTLNYEDYTHKSKFDFSFGGIGFELKDIDTNDFNTSDATLRFYSLLGDGGFVDLKSKIIGFKPLAVEGSLSFEASKLYTQWKYLQDSLNLEVADGKLSFYTDYSFNLDDLNSTSIDNLSLSLEKLRIKPKNKYKDVLNLDSFYIKNTTIKPMLQDVHVKKIGLESLYIKIKRDENRTIDWLEYIKSNTSAKASDTEKVWSVVVDDIALQKIKVDFDDAGIIPQVDTRVNEFNLYMQNVTLAGVEPLFYQMNTTINKDLKCDFRGDIRHKKLEVNSYSKCNNFNIIHYQPYIYKTAMDAFEVYDLNMKSAIVNFDVNISVRDVKEELIITLNDANFNLNKFDLNKRSTDENLLSFGSFDINGVQLNTKQRDVLVQKITLSDLDIKIQRVKDGDLNIQDLVVAHPKEPEATSDKEEKSESTQEEKGYSVVLKHFVLKLAKASFDDKTLTPRVLSKIDRFNIDAYDISSDKNTWLKYDFSLRVNGSGYASSKGDIRHTPLKQKGVFELEKISLKELTPYIQEKAYVSIDDGYFNLKSKLKYAVSKNSPDLVVDGSLSLQEFFVSDSRDNSAILSFTNLGLNSFTYEMSPNSLIIDEINLNSFYINAIIDENKQMNFASLLKSISDESNETEPKSEFPIKIMKMNVSSGSAHFADLSLPIKFKTNIHDLNGAVYAISNVVGETSYVEIDGVVDEYGSTKLKGSLNAGNPKAYTDIDFNFKNLELNSLSGYSASFAGYKIDKGKLYLDLGYNILDSELLGENSIIVKNIELGDEIEDENITTLPLGFVIALLEDSDGIIDIDMPIKGNVDEPDFKYGALVWKTLGNLVIKAVTSPFRFLGSLMGMDGEALEYAEFEAGGTNILPPEQEKLDNIAKMMIKRPKISLGVTGKYDEIIDKKAIQEQKLARIIVEKKGLKNIQDYKSAMTIDTLEEIYKELKDDKRLNNLKKKLEKKYKDETLDRAYLSALIQESKDIQSVSDTELIVLAKSRSEVIKNYLVNIKNIADTRVKLLEAGLSDEENEKLVKSKLQVEVE